MPTENHSATELWTPRPELAGDLVGKTVGDYELIVQLGRGGMGVVYKARQRRLNRIVALKMIRSGEFAHAGEVARFYAEAEAAAHLDHPNIVPVFEVGEHQGQHFFSMGFIDGQTLSQRVSSGPLPPREAAELVREIVMGVQYAHEQGVIHRDLKPQNILLASRSHGSASGPQSSAGSWGSQPTAEAPAVTPKITDFGLAKRLQCDSSLTETGAVLGTPSYMPPEQAAGRGREVGAVSDVYSLGAILYCLLTGRPPFQAATTVETLRQVLEQEPVAPRALIASTPLDLETITLKCLQKDPARRYATAAELGDDVARYLRGEPILARPVSPIERLVRWCKRNRAVASLAILAATLLVAGTIVSALFAWDADRQRTVAEDNASKWKQQEQRATKNEGLASAAATRATESATAAKRSAAFARQNQYFADVNLAEQVLASGDVAQCIELLENHIPSGGSEELRGFEWYYLWSLTHSAKFALSWDKILPNDPDIREIRVARQSPNGALLAVAGGWPNKGEVILYDAQTRAPVRTLPTQRTLVTAAAWSADSSRLATCSGHNDQPGEVTLCSATTGDAIWKVASDDPALALALSPDDQWLAVGTAKLTPGSGSPEDRFFRTASGPREGGVRILNAKNGALAATLPGDLGNIFSLAFSASGEILAVGNQRGEVLLFSVPTHEKIGEFRSGLRYIWSLDFAPQGDLLAAASGFWDEPGEVLLWNTRSRQVERRIRGHRGGATAVSFAVDGKILATGSFDRTVRLWNVSDASELATFYGHQGYIWDVGFGDGGQTLLAGAWRQHGSGEILGWDIAAGRRFTPLAKEMFYPGDYFRVVAASDTVAFIRDGQVDVWDAPSATLRFSVNWKKSAGEGARTLDLSPDGRLLAAGGFAPTTRILDTHSGQLIADLTTNTIPFLTFSPDGKLLATCGDDRVLRLFEAATGKALHALTGHTDIVWSASFSPDSRRLASASWDGTVRLWDPATGRALGAFRGHKEALWLVAFLDSGRTLLSRSGQQNQVIGIWDVSHVMAPPKIANLPPPSSRENLVIASYAMLAAARLKANDDQRADDALRELLAHARRHLASLPLIAAYTKYELNRVHDVIDLLVELSRWREADELCSLVDAVCQRQLAATPGAHEFEELQATTQIKAAEVAVKMGRFSEDIAHLKTARQTLLRLVEANPQNSDLKYSLAITENEFAWHVALHHNAPPELIDEAVMMARDCTARAPTRGTYFNTLGVILLRAKQWDEAVAALQKSCELRSGGDSNDWYPLAVALQHQGKAEEARIWFDRAEAWRKENPADDPDLNQLRDEADAEFVD